MLPEKDEKGKRNCFPNENFKFATKLVAGF